VCASCIFSLCCHYVLLVGPSKGAADQSALRCSALLMGFGAVPAGAASWH
jgi:hypothetical protein